MSEPSITASDWWEQHRLHYNAGLVAAGVLAFVCYAIALDRRISQGAMPGGEITLFTTVTQGIGYLFMMGIANVCYFAGPISERILKPKNVDGYRRAMFWLGFSFSVLLPFSVPIMILWSY